MRALAHIFGTIHPVNRPASEAYWRPRTRAEIAAAVARFERGQRH